MYLTKNKIIMAKIETTKSVDALCTVDDVIECTNAKMEQDSTMEKKDSYRVSISDPGGKIVDIKGKFSFEVDMKGSGTAGTRSQLGKLLLGCGMVESEVTDENENVIGLKYLPTSAQANMKTLTFYEYTIGDNNTAILKKLVGAMGTVSMTMEAGKTAKATFNFEGRYVEPIDASVPVVAVANYESSEPAIVENSNFKYDNVAYVCRGVTANLNHDLYSRPDVNSPTGVLETLITSRAWAGTMSPDMVSIATKNFFAVWKGNQKAQLEMQIGSEEGNIIKLLMPAIQLEKVNDSDDNGFEYQEIPFIMTGIDDELQITIQ